MILPFVVAIYFTSAIKLVSSVECLHYIISDIDQSNIESVDDRTCTDNYCTFVLTEKLVYVNNVNKWVPTRYARECTNDPKITIGNKLIDSVNACNIVYDSQDQVRYSVKICNSNFCNEQCETTSTPSPANVNIIINPNCCQNNNPYCCQNIHNAPNCCNNKKLPLWPPLGPQINNHLPTLSSINNDLNTANLKCCNSINPQCCFNSESINTCCTFVIKVIREMSVGNLITTTTIQPTTSNLPDSNDLFIISNICCHNSSPNCCGHSLNANSCCNNYHKFLHPGPVISNTNDHKITSFSQPQSLNALSKVKSKDNENIVNNPFSHCCDSTNPFCCIPIENANSCCKKVLYRNIPIPNYEQAQQVTSLHTLETKSASYNHELSIFFMTISLIVYFNL
uniref:DUF753 domain-containing protein n=1 Tax=Parastrongyloides trichosuri TaxID=131310 RepID=A0A0N4Z334_PARTI